MRHEEQFPPPRQRRLFSLGNANYRPMMRGIAVRHKAYVNICGIDTPPDID
jgi:hypothetical protein